MKNTATPEELRLHELIRARLEVFRDRLGPRLGAACDQLFDRLELGRPSTAVRPGYFINPLALPVLQIPSWMGKRAAREGRELPREVLHDLAESAAAGYLHVRIQDDLLDEGVGRPAEAMLLAEAFFVRHQSLLGRNLGGNEKFWQRYRTRWHEYQEAMLFENELMSRPSGIDESAFDRILRRSQPLELPGAAALECAGLRELLPHLEGFVRHLVRGHQLFHDLIDADKDHGAGNITFVVQRLGGSEGADTLHRRMLLEGGFDEITEESLSELRSAEVAARRGGFDEALAYLRSRERLVEETRREVFESLFRRILAKSP